MTKTAGSSNYHFNITIFSLRTSSIVGVFFHADSSYQGICQRKPYRKLSFQTEIHSCTKWMIFCIENVSFFCDITSVRDEQWSTNLQTQVLFKVTRIGNHGFDQSKQVFKGILSNLINLSKTSSSQVQVSCIYHVENTTLKSRRYLKITTYKQRYFYGNRLSLVWDKVNAPLRIFFIITYRRSL